jgi:hypothetical protein
LSNMRSLSAAELLDLWERSCSQSLTAKAVSLAVAASPDSTWEEVAGLPIGRRDRFLLKVRETLFGSKFTIVTSCPQCRDPAELTFGVSDLWQESSSDSSASWTVTFNGYCIIFRLPSSADILSLPASEKLEILRERLFGLCVLEAYDTAGDAVSAESLPPPVVAAVTEAMAAADSQGEVMLNLICPACQYSWRAVFDITAFLSKEIHFWAQRTLHDVHELAHAYGWTEAEVLALSPTRRQLYLELSRQ